MNTDFNFSNNRKGPSQEHISKFIRLAKARVNGGVLLKPGTYQKYIDYLRTKPVTGVTEKHHIIPKHMQGSNDPSNLIQISVRDHILAHLLLYLEQGGNGNLLAYALRQSSQHIDLRSQSKRIDFMNKIENKGWYDPNVQRRLGKKGGKVGGSRNTQTQWDARSKVGQAYGRSTGLANQSEALRNSLQSTLVFSHKKALDKLILVPPQQAVIEVARYINDQCDILGISDLKLDLNKVRSGGPFYGLLKKTKPSAYGWIILDQYKTEDLDD